MTETQRWRQRIPGKNLAGSEEQRHWASESLKLNCIREENFWGKTWGTLDASLIHNSGGKGTLVGTMSMWDERHVHFSLKFSIIMGPLQFHFMP